ncbi:sel1 repeat family protein [Desulfovibrio desulfuricans]|uniref:Sel1 repeat family protein n=1 Tax=Desulfovibrio desulfuricans TaxID=876 RepID=A0A4P7UJY4_DESDE|nr:tetratricopeptide repeat protein [Desulfovibrio desulfuricans]QCC86017.1 sel1 repeat family protein [Desulfovibrio desulfuricans]
MKKLSSAILLAAVLVLGAGMVGTVLAAPAKSAQQTLDEAWTAYNIGQYNKVVQMVQPLASDGNPRAQVLLARCYENGLGVVQDMETAAKWFRLAAEQNYAEGQVQLGYLYELGAGVPKNDAAVADLMSRAANAGNAEAQFNLSLYASQGRYGFAKNPEQSFAWAKRSADQGFAQAQRYVGACYEYGVGVSVNPSEAAAWYSKAAAQGLEKEGNIFNTEREYTMP